jgi:hypothetical protein
VAAANDRPLGRWLRAGLWAGLIFLLSSIPGSAFPRVDAPGLDKLVHVALFAPLGWLLLAALLPRAGEEPAAAAAPELRRRRLRLLGRLLLALALGVAWGALDELHQYCVPGRSVSSWDFLANALGVCLALALWLALARRRTACEP